MRTKAAVLYEINKPLIIEDLEIPELKPGQVLVKIAYSGVCHSQLNEIQGLKGEDKFLPHVLGHEGSGTIEAVGPNVNKVKLNEPVILSWIKGKGLDVPSTTYQGSSGTTINSGAIATFMEYAVASENRVTPIRKDMPLDKAALLGCAVATGAGAVINTAKAEPGSKVAVFGTGGIGLCAIQAATLVGAAKVIAVDIYEHKLRLAGDFGATDTINASNQDPVSVIKDLTDGKGADYAIEATGIKEVMEQAFLSVRDNGGTAVIVGNPPHQQRISIDPFALICGKRIVGSWGGDTNPERDFPHYADLYLAGKLKLDELLTHRFQLEDIDLIFLALQKGDVGRAIIEF
ncbi:zinc-binding dehydrogenase [Chloroflexota bacterium]